MYYTYLESPIGALLLSGDGHALTGLHFTRGPKTLAPDPAWERRDAVFDNAARQLAEYFEGHRQRFDLALAPAGTPFQLAVLSALTKIPYGETRSYGQVAQALGKPTAGRAVGAANGRNPIAIIIPCHRVIGANGSLTGFGGGLPAKRYLLALESPRHNAPTDAQGRLPFPGSDTPA